MDFTYLLVIVLVVVLAIIGACTNINRNKALFIILFIILLAFCGFRAPLIYPDMNNYQEYFLKGEFLNADADENVNLGYEILNKSIKLFFPSFYFFNFIVTFIILISYFWYIKRNSEMPYFSIVLFVFLAYFSCFFLLRQYLATAISMIAFSYVVKKKQYEFLIWTLIAISFHTSAFVILPVYYIYTMPINNKSITLLFILSIFIALSLHTIATSLLAFSEYYSRYLNSDYEATPIRLLMKTSLLLLYLYAIGKGVYVRGLPFLIFICILIECVIYIGSSGIDGIYRLRAYFELGEFIGIPLIWVRNKKNHRIKRVIVRWGVILYVFFIMLSCYSFLSSSIFAGGYKTIFSK